jgi:hypothetical protein
LNIGYVEVTENHDLDVWVQWLTDDGKARDLTDWTAVLDTDVPGKWSA